MPTKKQDLYDEKIKALEKKLAEIKKAEEKVEDEHYKKIRKLEQELMDLKEDAEESTHELIPPPSRYREPSSNDFWVNMFAGGFSIGMLVLWLFRVGAFFYLWNAMDSGFWGFLQTVVIYIVIHFIAKFITYLFILIIGGLAALITNIEDVFHITGVILFPVLHTIFIWLLVRSVVAL